MSTATVSPTASAKTLKAMRLEAKTLQDGIAALKSKGDECTPEDAKKIRADTAFLKSLVAQIKDTSFQESAAEADQLDADLKTIFEPDRPDFSGTGIGRGNTPALGNLSERWAAAAKSLGQCIVESEQYKNFSPSVQGSMGIEFANLVGIDGHTKTTFTTSGSTLTQFERPPGIVTLGQQRPTVADLMPTGMTTVNTIRYVREDTFTNAATTVTEGSAKPEASWDTSEVDAAVRKIAVWTKITNEMYDDFPQLQSFFDDRLRYMVAMREEAQILNGDGNAPNLRGILQTSGIQTQAQGSDTPLDAIHKALTKVQAVGFYEPDGIVLHPTDYQILRLEKDMNDQYFGGGPFTGAYGVNGYPGLIGPWGLRPIVTTSITAGTALVGAFRMGAQIFRRAGVTVSMTNSDQDDFVKNLITLRCETRLALCVYRPLAFCTVTSIAAS